MEHKKDFAARKKNECIKDGIMKESGEGIEI